MKSFKELVVWQKSHELVVEIYKVTKDFPKDEMFGITSQIRRAVVSIPLNIAEGTGRYYINEATRFYYISRGSLYETENLILICKDLGFIDLEKLNYFNNKITEISMLLNGLIKYSKGRKLKNSDLRSKNCDQKIVGVTDLKYKGKTEEKEVTNA